MATQPSPGRRPASQRLNKTAKAFAAAPEHLTSDDANQCNFMELF
jgi:hypothetical protein